MKLTSALVAALAAAAAGLARAEQTPSAPHTPAEGEWPVVIYHTSGMIKMGIQDGGQLNYNDGSGTSIQGTSAVGLRFVDKMNALGRGADEEYESTAAGCVCEGWGAAYGTVGTAGLVSGAANEDDGGLSNIVAGPLTSSAACMSTPGPTTCNAAHATAVLGGCLQVEHDYAPSSDSDLAMVVGVTLTNTCPDPIDELYYRRSMDWDIEPNAFTERVLNNPGNAVDLTCLTDDGFCSSNPTSPCTGINSGGCAPLGAEQDTGVEDHGANFDFKFVNVNATNPLGQGDSYSFTTFYGAAPSTAAARTELGKLGVEAYSLGEYVAPSVGGDGLPGPTHFFAFAGVGGSIVIPPPTDDVFAAPCGACSSTSVSSGSSSVTLTFPETGPYDAECV